jgi:hypothetical protein
MLGGCRGAQYNDTAGEGAFEQRFMDILAQLYLFTKQ